VWCRGYISSEVSSISEEAPEVGVEKSNFLEPEVGVVETAVERANLSISA
jgi:hypothetical protein